MAFQGASPKARDLRWDDEVKGFCVRVWPSGAKSFCLSYRHRGRQRLMVLGPYGELTVQQARDLARAAKLLVRQGKDPLAEKRRPLEGRTFGELAEEYVRRHAPKKASFRDDVGLLRNHILRSWRRRQLDSITRADVVNLHHAITAGKTRPEHDDSAAAAAIDGRRSKHGKTTGGAVVANRAVALLSTMFNLAKDWGYLAENAPNPTARVKRNAETRRERFVTPDEMPALAKAIEAEPNVFVRAAIWLYLLTGARKMALLRLEWKHVDVERRLLFIPETKTGSFTTQPLTSHVAAILAQVPRLTGNPYVFCSHIKGRHLVEIKRNWETIRTAAGIADVRIHDLRHTLGTWLAYSNHSEKLIGKALNNTHATARYINLRADVLIAPLEEHGARIRAAMPPPQPPVESPVYSDVDE